MKQSVRFTRGRVVFNGRVPRAPFAAWIATPEGRAIVASTASAIRFSLFGKTNAAERRVFRQLSEAASDPRIVAIVQGELEQYLTRLADFGYANGLPRVGIELHRLVVVPRVLINATTLTSLSRKLAAAAAFTSLDHSGPLLDFFALAVVCDADAALNRIAPSPAHPLPAGTDWITVGSNRKFVWRGPSLREPAWPGHHFVFEVMRDPITRRVRKMLDDGIARLESGLPSLTQLQRAEILRRAHGA